MLWRLHASTGSMSKGITRNEKNKEEILDWIDNLIEEHNYITITQQPEEAVTCKLCHEEAVAKWAHAHDGSYVGDECCWDERLRSTE